MFPQRHVHRKVRVATGKSRRIPRVSRVSQPWETKQRGSWNLECFWCYGYCIGYLQCLTGGGQRTDLLVVATETGGGLLTLGAAPRHPSGPSRLKPLTLRPECICLICPTRHIFIAVGTASSCISASCIFLTCTTQYYRTYEYRRAIIPLASPHTLQVGSLFDDTAHALLLC